MVDEVKVILYRLLEPINTSLSALMGILTLFWGIWVISPFWNAFGTADLYDKMGEFAPEWAWGTWSVTAGSILIYTALRKNYKQLTNALAFISWHWFTVSSLMWVGDWQNTGPVTYTMITCYSLFCYLNIKLNYIGIDPNSRINRLVLKILRDNRG